MDLKRHHNSWVAVQVRPKYEFMTAKILRNKGYEELVPSYQVRKKWSDRWKVIEAPLFTSYVFCKINAEACWPIVTTPGVIRILGTGTELARIDDSEIEAIQMLMRSKVKAEPCAYVNIGQRVRLIDGPLAGVEAIVAGYKNRRLILSVSVVQGSIAVEIEDSSFTSIISNRADYRSSCENRVQDMC